MRWTNESRAQTCNLERLEVCESKLFTQTNITIQRSGNNLQRKSMNSPLTKDRRCFL